MRTDGDVALLLALGETRLAFLLYFWCVCGGGVGLKVFAGQTQRHHKSSPPHSQSLASLSGTAAGGSASGAQSGRAAGR